MNWLSYILTGALILAAAYLAFWPEEAGPPPTASMKATTVSPPGSPEEGARRFAERQPNCARVVRVERVSQSRPLFRIECEDHEGRSFSLQFASSDEGPAGVEQRP